MVNALNRYLIQKLIRNLHGNSLDDIAVQRIAGSITSISITLEGADGLPTSFQLISRPFSEAMLFRVAAAYEGETNWHKNYQRYDLYV